MPYDDREMRLASFFVEREGEGILDTLREVDLVEVGILDSLDFVGLAVHIENEFGCRLDLTDAEVFRKLRRFDSMMQLIEETCGDA